jgi:MFS family permease
VLQRSRAEAGPRYGWRIVAAGAGLHALIGALFLQAYGAYFVLLRQEFGWSRTVLSAAFSMIRAESGLLGPVHGWLVDRFGARRIILVGVILFAGGFALFATTGSLLTFFGFVFVLTLGASAGDEVVLSTEADDGEATAALDAWRAAGGE